MQTPTNTPRAATGFDLENRALTDPLLSSMVRVGVAAYLPLLARAGDELVRGLDLTPLGSGTDGKMPNAPGKQGGGDGNDSPRDLGPVRRTLRF